MKQNLARAGAGKVVCRICKGDHFTAKCPHKDTLGSLAPGGKHFITNGSCYCSLNRTIDVLPPTEEDAPDGPGAGGAAAATTGGRYVPPSLRNRGPGERPPGAPGAASRDELPTLRVTNISEDVEENDLRDLFGAFGRVARVYVGRDRETGAGKGFAFVSFEDREVAKRAMEKLHGRGYDNLILSVQWSRECLNIVLLFLCAKGSF
jgi:translation initiation factor 3 subunit G